MDDDKRLAAYFAEVSGELMSETSEVTFDRVVRRAVEVIPGADHCGIILRTKGGRAETVAATSDVVHAVHAAQFELGQGPCLDAAFDRENCVVPDLREESRWPQWVPVALQNDVRGVVAIRLHSARETLGALNVYSTTAGALDADNVDIALIFAAHATEALSKARLVSNLEAALESRHLIGMAQGVVAARYDVPYETAFTVLQRYSNDTNTKLRDVAQMVVDARGMPGSLTAGEQPRVRGA